MNPAKPTKRKALLQQKDAMLDINAVLGKVVGEMGLERRLKEHTLMTLWPVLCGDAFANKSRPIFIDYEGRLVVAVQDSTIAQELSLKKSELTQKLQAAARSIGGISISGVRFDLKHYHKTDDDLSALVNRKTVALPEPTDEQLAAVQLSPRDQLELSQLTARLSENITNFTNMNQRILLICEKQLRLKQWQRENKYPQCTSCGAPEARLHGDNSLCRNCYFLAVEAGDI